MSDTPIIIFGMVSNRRPSSYSSNPLIAPLEGLEASRRAGWAKFYSELERANGLVALNHQQRERIALLLEALMNLTEAVLSAKNVDAFALAYRIKGLIDSYLNEETA